MINSPYDILPYRFELSWEKSDDPLVLEYSVLMCDPIDYGQWVSACLLRMYVLSTAPKANTKHVDKVPKEDYSQAVKISWDEIPPHVFKLRDLNAGFGNPEPSFILLVSQQPLISFKFIRSLGLDEITGYACLDHTKLLQLLEIFHQAGIKPAVIGDSEAAKKKIEELGLTETTPDRQEAPRFDCAFVCPEILKPLFGLPQQIQTNPEQILCECSAPATVHLTEAAQGKTTEYDFCEVCAKTVFAPKRKDEN